MADQEDQVVEIEFEGLERSPTQKVDRWATVVGARNSALQPEEKEGDKPSEDNGDKEKKKKGDKPRPASLIKLFRYATLLDWLLMFIGTVMAICHGAALPSLMLIFGDLTNSFINQAASRELYNSLLDSDSVNCSFRLAGSNVSGTISSECGFEITNTTTFENVLTECFSSAVDCLDDDDFIDEINMQILTFVGIGVGVFIAANLQIALFQIACERQTHKIQLKFYRAVLRQNIGWFDSNPSGELASRLTDDINKIHDGIGDKVALLIQWLAVFFGGFIVGFVKEWRLTLLLLAFTPFLAIAGGIMTKVISTFTSQEQKQYASAGAVAEEVLSSLRTVVAFGGEYKEQERYNDKLKEARELGAKKGAFVGVSFGFLFFLIFIVDSAAFWFGAYLISEELTQGGDVITVFFAVLIGAFALGQGAPNLQNLLQAAGAAGTIYDIIDREPPIDSSSEKGLVLEKFDSTIEFNNVTFTYPTRPDVQVMSGLTLKVDVGQTVALVGPSGCGKSTVMQLLQRFYEPDGGEILVSGKDIQSLNLKWLRSNIGLVSQEPVLFDTTIAENIRYGAENATMEEIKEAAANANAHNFISELPNGYNTLVGERGTQLSGGQKQRIAIARALVRDPKILLLDEATSALDTESEAIVQAALDHAREGRTTLVIAHRLSTIQQANVIASIEDGCVVEMGTHDELMANKGLYYELVTTQSYATDEAFVGRGLGKLMSRQRSRHHSEREDGDPAIMKQVSLQKQASTTSDGKPEEKLKISEKQQELWDKEVPEVPLWRVIKVNAKEWWIIILGLLGAAVAGSIWPLFGVLFGEFLDVFALPADEVVEESHLWGGLLIVLGIVSGLGVFTRTICFSVSGEYLTTRLRSRAFKAMLRQEVGWHDDERNSSGILTTRLANDAGQVQGATGSRLGTLVETFFGMIVAIVIAFVYSWVLTLLILAVVPIMIVAGFLEVKALSGHAASNKKALEDAGKIAVDSIDNIRTVASLGVEDNFFMQYEHNVHKPYKRSLLNTVVYGMTYAISQSTIYLMYAVVFRFGAFQVIQDRDNIAYEEFDKVFTVFTALIFGAVAVGEAGAFAPNYAKARLSANRIFSLLDREPLIDGYSKEGITVEKVVGEVAAKGVEFSYPARPQVKVLQSLSVSVVPGHSLALVGPSGCGKSTVVSLVERFYDPAEGNLTLDGNDLKVLNIRWLRSQIGIVSQEPVLFDTSIAENIRYGANFRQVSDDEVIEAAKAANIHSFIDSLPQGYSTNVGAKGTQLSGGQKQRIAIARALVRDPKILLLDEATSALDTESEKIVQEALDKAREGRTSIVIAHRLSTIYNADCIAVIKDGRVAEMGTHSELIAKRGIYFKLNRFQMMDSEEEKI